MRICPMHTNGDNRYSKCSLYLSSGWILWRSQSRHRGFGWKLLAGALLLQGFMGLDKPQWAVQAMGLVRVPFQGLLSITMGIAMAVLVLEAGRSRMEDLNEKLTAIGLDYYPGHAVPPD